MAKQFYAVEPKKDIKSSLRNMENVEYSINALISMEAECMAENVEDLSDDDFEKFVIIKCAEIKTALMRDGIYRNEHGIPLFLYC